MKILLIAPGEQDNIETQIVREIPFLHSGAFFAPHALAAVAALCPTEHEIEIHDEYMHGPIQDRLADLSADIIGISVRAGQNRHSADIARACKNAVPQAMVIAGGMGVSSLSGEQRNAFDAIFYGEAELTLQEFFRDVERGAIAKTYQHYEKTDMTRTPPPRWDLIAGDIALYGAVSVQTTRGCPFDCSFCDVIYTHGRVLRAKSIEQVLGEVRQLERLGASVVFFADDNFTADRTYAKRLLRDLISLNNSFDVPLFFMTQVDVTIAQDDELLELLADANFIELMIGIESVNEASLREMNKKQNLHVNPREAVTKIQSYGIAVLGHLIFGNDSDDLSVFGLTEKFANEVNLTNHFCHPLMAPPGTRVWYHYKRSGRLIDPPDGLLDNLDIATWIVPKQMSRVELFEGLADYWEKVHEPSNYVKRAVGFLHGVKRRAKVKRPGLKGLLKTRKRVLGTMLFYATKAGPTHRMAFFKVLMTAGRHSNWLVPRAAFLYTHFLMEHKRAIYNARIARQQAQWERDNPYALHVSDHNVPMSQSVRDNMPGISQAAYNHVNNRVPDRESLFRVVVEAVADYSDRFGKELSEFDRIQQTYVEESCDRILAAQDFPAAGENQTIELPQGFSREILDAVDRNIRSRERTAV